VILNVKSRFIKANLLKNILISDIVYDMAISRMAKHMHPPIITKYLSSPATTICRIRQIFRTWDICHIKVAYKIA
jgi:hypothetical protein